MYVQNNYTLFYVQSSAVLAHLYVFERIFVCENSWFVPAYRTWQMRETCIHTNVHICKYIYV